VNLAPYSFFNMLSDNPFLVWFSSDGGKGQRHQCRADRRVRRQPCDREIWPRQMVASSVDAPHGVDEFDYAGLTHAPCRLVKPPRVAEAAAALECKVTEVLRPRGLGGRGGGNIVVIGEVVGVHIDDAMLTNGMFDVVKAGNLARLGYLDYSTVESVFPMRRPAGRQTDQARPSGGSARQQAFGAPQVRPVVHLAADADDALDFRRRRTP
jgi:flavin reductase (DIM6/NTAB) family NADH-FMN oxidoreductase RutF